MCNFFRKDFDVDKTNQNSKLRKDMEKRCQVLLHLTQELIYRFIR